MSAPTARIDPRLKVAQAKRMHKASITNAERAAESRAKRDELIVELRAEDPVTWTYARLGHELGCSPELIALIMRKSAEQAHQAEVDAATTVEEDVASVG